MQDYYGWRAKIGLIYPAEGLVMEPEFSAMAPQGVSIHTARVDLTGTTLEGLANMMDDDRIEVAARMLGFRTPTNVVTFGGTSATFMRGIGYDREIIARMEGVMTDVPASTTSTAALRALKAVGAKRLSFVGPYVADVTKLGGEFFAANGFEVTGAHGMGVSDNLELNDISLERTYAYTKSVVEPEADAVFVSCTGLRTVGAIEALEADLGVPVVTAIQATLWDCLCIAKVHEAQPGFGSLFECFPGH
jgi:maleate isomerase